MDNFVFQPVRLKQQKNIQNTTSEVPITSEVFFILLEKQHSEKNKLLMLFVPSTVPVEGQVWGDRPGRNITFF